MYYDGEPKPVKKDPFLQRTEIFLTKFSVPEPEVEPAPTVKPEPEVEPAPTVKPEPVKHEPPVEVHVQLGHKAVADVKVILVDRVRRGGLFSHNVQETAENIVTALNGR
jgi:hypothetical protein